MHDGRSRTASCAHAILPLKLAWGGNELDPKENSEDFFLNWLGGESRVS